MFNLKKIKLVKINAFLKEKNVDFVGIWVSNNSLLTVSWICKDNFILNEEIFIFSLIYTIWVGSKWAKKLMIYLRI